MRQFPENDETDYEALKEQRANDRQSIKDSRNAYKIDEDDLMARFAAAAEAASPEQRRSAAAKATIGGDGSVRRNSNSTPSRMPDRDSEYRPSEMSKYAEIEDVLGHFKFASEMERRARQMKIVANALRTTLQELVLEEVAVNTKTAFKGHAEKVVKAPGGLKVYFNFGEGKMYAVTAKGGFSGDETICVAQSGTKIRASVLRIEDGDYNDLSANFDINIVQVKES